MFLPCFSPQPSTPTKQVEYTLQNKPVKLTTDITSKAKRMYFVATKKNIYIQFWPYCHKLFTALEKWHL